MIKQSPMMKQWMTGRTAIVLAVALLAGGMTSGQDAPAGGDSSEKLKSGLTPTAQLLQLMDTDQNGKVSKQEFMHFMEAEFDYADKNADQALDPRELKSLVQGMNHPRVNGPGR
jgi:hypothetical protein